MYQVITVITPIQYATRLNKAIDRYNTDQQTTVTNLDIGILQALYEAKKGLRNATIMRAVRNRIFADRFTRSLERLIILKYIVRTEYKNAVYYTITLQGRKAIQELNDHLIAIVNGQ